MVSLFSATMTSMMRSTVPAAAAVTADNRLSRCAQLAPILGGHVDKRGECGAESREVREDEEEKEANNDDDNGIRIPCVYLRVSNNTKSYTCKYALTLSA